MLKLAGTKLVDISSFCFLLAVVEFLVLSVGGYVGSFSPFVDRVLHFAWFAVPVLLLTGVIFSVVSLRREQDKVNTGVALMLNLVPLLWLIYMFFF